MEKLKQLLVELDVCISAREWAGDKTIEDVVQSCERGDWLLLLAKKVGMDLQPLTLAKGHCAATVLHLMNDETSKKAVQVAIDFGNGLATRDQLDASLMAAADAYAANAAYVAADAAYAAAKKENQKLTADICRKYIGDILIKLINDRLN